MIFPRPRGRGPVEAGCQTAATVSAKKHFRARAGAAPLKQIMDVGEDWMRRNFRARAGAAPLKPEDTNQLASFFQKFPRPRGRGPVEATTAVCSALSFDIISAPARARPR